VLDAVKAMDTEKVLTVFKVDATLKNAGDEICPARTSDSLQLRRLPDSQ